MGGLSFARARMAVVAAVCALGVAPAAAAVPVPADGQVPVWAAEALEAEARDVGALRSAATAGRLADAYRAAGGAAQAVVAPPLPAHLAARLRVLPVALQAPIARLWAATSAADAVLGTTSARQLRAWRDDVSTALADPAHAVTAAPATTLRQRARALATVLAALDETLPLLTAQAASGSGARAESCDYLDLRPQLCIGGESGNVHRHDASLLIDLGGDDQYLNAAGGAPFATTTTPSSYALLSVSVDLAGDDTYVAGTGTPVLAQTFLYGQGAGVGGGVGVLVDAAGNDSYRAAAAMSRTQLPDGRPWWRAAAVVQGSGVAGAGALIDLGGSDTYTADVREVDAPSGAVDVRTTVLAAQGGAADSPGCAGAAPPEDPGSSRYGCSEGLLLDLGQGGDAYAMTAILPFHHGHGSALEATGLVWGQGSGGVPRETAATLYDGGGTDTFTVAAELGWNEHSRTAAESIGRVAAQGALGAGQLVTGDGDTTYRVATVEHGFLKGAGLFVFAQGGSGTLDDAGGDDAYDVAYEWTDQQRRVRGSCGAVPADCTAGRAGVVGDFYRNARIEAQGAGSHDHGVLRDHAGDDRYGVTAETLLDVAMDQAASSAPVYVKGFADPRVVAQGMGLVLPYGGLLADAGGTDRYDISSSNVVRLSPTLNPQNVTAYLQAWPGHISGQGAGARAALLDFGGTGDRFAVAARHDIEAPAGITEYLTRRLPDVQGVGDAAFVALGDAPTLSSSPAALPCSGHRGYGAWSSGQVASCAVAAHSDPAAQSQGQSGGFGLAPRATAAAPAYLTLAEPAAVTVTTVDDHTLLAAAPDRVEVSGQLTDARGALPAGTVVHVALQSQPLLPGGGVDPRGGWSDLHSVDAVTDGDGGFTAAVPTQLYALQLGNLPVSSFRFQVLAWTDGAHGEHYPARAAAVLTAP